MRNFLLLISTLILLSGCSNPKKIISKEFTNTDLVASYSKEKDLEETLAAIKVPMLLPNHLFENCTPKIPATKDKYISLTLEERETYLVGYSIELLTVIKICNSNLQRIYNLERMYR